MSETVAQGEGRISTWLAPREGSRRRLVIAWTMLLVWVGVLVYFYAVTPRPATPASQPVSGTA